MVSPLNFEDKKKLLFDCLTSAEQSIKGTNLEQKDEFCADALERNQSKEVSRRFQGKESIFKRPQAPIGKCLRPRRTPDYQMNPHKWKKYSLGDTDISDKTNSSAAFAFLAEIEKRKDAEREKSDDDDVDTGDKIVFKSRNKTSRPSFNKSVSLKRELDTSSTSNEEIGEKSVLKGSKLVMPEYVIGQRSKNKKKKSNATTSTDETKPDKNNRKGPQLKHLFGEDEDEDADDID